MSKASSSRVLNRNTYGYLRVSKGNTHLFQRNISPQLALGSILGDGDGILRGLAEIRAALTSCLVSSLEARISLSWPCMDRHCRKPTKITTVSHTMAQVASAVRRAAR